ncbi:MAG: prepilin-type N-terminal cleavage/methylation domain-containing protein, partial [Coraliomargarita sp.]
MNTKSKKGFTLVEIMIVVVIIGLLAAMAIPAFQKVRENAIDKG